MIIDALDVVEGNHLGHFTFLPQKLGFEIQQLHRVTLIHCGLKTSMFNIAYGSPKGVDTSDAIEEIKNVFCGKPFAWWIPPTQVNQEVTQHILKAGLKIETVEHAMVCPLDHATLYCDNTDLEIHAVKDKRVLEDFLKVLEIYDPHVGSFYQRMDEALFDANERLFVGYAHSKPVTIGIVFLNQDRAGVFSLITNQEVRGRGYGTQMMTFLMQFAKHIGCHVMTLSASSDAGYRIYERLGFEKIGAFECFEYEGA